MSISRKITTGTSDAPSPPPDPEAISYLNIYLMGAGGSGGSGNGNSAGGGGGAGGILGGTTSSIFTETSYSIVCGKATINKKGEDTTFSGGAGLFAKATGGGSGAIATPTSDSNGANGGGMDLYSSAGAGSTVGIEFNAAFNVASPLIKAGYGGGRGYYDPNPGGAAGGGGGAGGGKNLHTETYSAASGSESSSATARPLKGGSIKGCAILTVPSQVRDSFHVSR